MMIQQELGSFNERQVVYYLRYDDATKKVAEFGCLNLSDHDARGSLIRPSGVIDAQADFPPHGGVATWVLVRNGMEMVEAPDEPGYFESPYQTNLSS